MIQFDEHMFQIGWFNHQLVMIHYAPCTLPETAKGPWKKEGRRIVFPTIMAFRIYNSLSLDPLRDEFDLGITIHYLEDHPMTCKWLITMVIVSPLSRVVIPLPNELNGLYMGVTNHLLTGMILQVRVVHLQIHPKPTNMGTILLV